MRHYFIDRVRSADEYFTFSCDVAGYHFEIRSANDIFSKNEIDLGTRTLIDTFIERENVEESCEILDLACGYGIVGLVLAKKYNCIVDMSDINHTALDLARQNAKNNNCTIRNIIETSGCDGCGTYDYILCNPPIKVGKDITIEILSGTYSHLNVGGKLYIVIRKDHGMNSIKELLEKIYGNCEIVERNKGHYILCCKK